MVSNYKYNRFNFLTTLYLRHILQVYSAVKIHCFLRGESWWWHHDMSVVSGGWLVWPDQKILWWKLLWEDLCPLFGPCDVQNDAIDYSHVLLWWLSGDWWHWWILFSPLSCRLKQIYFVPLYGSSFITASLQSSSPTSGKVLSFNELYLLSNMIVRYRCCPAWQLWNTPTMTCMNPSSFLSNFHHSLRPSPVLARCRQSFTHTRVRHISISLCKHVLSSPARRDF